MSVSATTVDHGALKANQLVIIVLNLTAFILQSWPLAALTALAMFAGTVLGKPGFYPLYAGVIRPLGLVKADPIADDPRPHRFAQGFGAFVMGLGVVFLVLGADAAGWTAVWIVALLAGVNVSVGFCAGCFVFYQLARLGVPGFAGTAPEGIFPGMRRKAAPPEA